MKLEVAAVVALKTSTTDQLFAVPTCTATQCCCTSALPVAGAAIRGRVHRPTRWPEANTVTAGGSGACQLRTSFGATATERAGAASL